MFDREWTKNDQENHCPEDGHSFRPGIAFTISTNQLHLQENDREGLKLFGIYWPSGKTGLLFQMFRCSWQFSVFKKSCSIYFPTGKQPWSWASASPRKIKNIRICMGKNPPFQNKTTKMKGIQLKRKIFHWEPLKIFSLGIWPRGRDEDRRGTRLPFGARNFCRTFREWRVFVFCRNNFLECPVTVRSRLCTCHWKGWGFVGAYTCPRGEV